MRKQKMISAYTPSNTDPEVLKRIFVQREQLLERIADRLAVSMTTGDKHHILLVGPRGSGKTNFVTLAHWELTQNPALSDSMRIAWLGEDDTFSSLLHLAFGIAKALADAYPTEFHSDFKAAVRGLPSDDAALSVLRTVIANLKHRHLLLITENLDQTFQGIGEDGQKKLRAFLQETRRIATLATTQQLFPGVSSRNEAFFGFFDPIHLEPLTVENAQQLILKVATEQGKTDLIQFLNSNKARYRIRALHHLAGGNHRMYVLLAEFLTQDTLDDLVAAFENLAEEMTPYFQERMRSLPQQQRQLVQSLCDAAGAMTVKQLVEETFIAEGNCSKQLGNLKAKGYVRSEKRGKESYYDMAEPLMRLCLEVKNQRRRPLKLVASFLKAWFPQDRLQASLQEVNSQSRLAEYCQLAMQDNHSFESAINLNLVAEIKQRIADRDLDRARDLAEELSVSDHHAGLKYRLEVALISSDWSNAITLLNETLKADATVEEKAAHLLVRAFINGELENYQAELADYCSLLQMPDAPAEEKSKALLSRGFMHYQRGEVRAGFDDFTKLLQLSDAPGDVKALALFFRGQILKDNSDFYGAINDFTELIEIPSISAEQRADALFSRGASHNQLGKLKEAIIDFSQLLRISNLKNEKIANALLLRGIAHWKLADDMAALEDFTKLTLLPAPLGAEKATALLLRGSIHGHRKEWHKSKSDFLAALSHADISPNVLTMISFALPEPMIVIDSLHEVVTTLSRAFATGDKSVDAYGGKPIDLILLIVQRGPSEWESYIQSIAPLYIQHKVAEKLGSGITQSIKFLDEGDFSASQLDRWYQAWQSVGQGVDELEIPLQCLRAAVEVLKSDPPNDRPLFSLPLEIRDLVRPLLRNKLGETEQ